MNCTKRRIMVASALVFFFTWFMGSQVGWGQTAHTAKLMEEAKKEGKLFWYTSMAIDTSKPMLDAFLKQYPFI